ncbi:MAG: tail fiber protein, partial [Bacteroidales bacterium]|nr:tail fiber protein [Bacteroidales bacterium]
YGNGSGFFAGRVGIGTTAYPAEMLHVVGNSYITGNVGIGIQNTSNYKLKVKGEINSDEVTVENTANWPDFVFDENYKKQSLSEIEDFIKANKHLPNVPSACEVEENGIQLGEMNKILLQKIEELTLQMIDLKKEIDEIKKGGE